MDLGGKASKLKEKNQARAQLAGAPLLVAQVEELEFRSGVWTGFGGRGTGDYGKGRGLWQGGGGEGVKV